MLENWEVIEGRLKNFGGRLRVFCFEFRNGDEVNSEEDEEEEGEEPRQHWPAMEVPVSSVNGRN